MPPIHPTSLSSPNPDWSVSSFDSGHIVPLGPEARAAVEANYNDQTRALGEVDGVAVGVPFQVSVKSLVWYRPEIFDQLGLMIPTTLGELETLVQETENAGLAPWCLGIEAQAATGWVATDWTEEMVLRLAGPDVYDEWVRGDVGFADPAIADAFTAVRRTGAGTGPSRRWDLRGPAHVAPGVPPRALRRSARLCAASTGEFRDQLHAAGTRIRSRR